MVFDLGLGEVWCSLEWVLVLGIGRCALFWCLGGEVIAGGFGFVVVGVPVVVVLHRRALF